MKVKFVKEIGFVKAGQIADYSNDVAHAENLIRKGYCVEFKEETATDEKPVAKKKQSDKEVL